MRNAPSIPLGKRTSHAFPSSENGRHLLTVRRGGWAVVNAHAESGGRAAERDHRATQLAYMSRLHELHEHEDGQLWVFAGDFNVREGEDHCLRAEGWHDVWIGANAGGACLDMEARAEYRAV